jgi:small-conductance mechanosensitive channel
LAVRRSVTYGGIMLLLLWIARELNFELGPLLDAGGVRAIIVAALGIPLVMALSRLTRLEVSRRFTAQQGMIAGNVIYYFGLAFVVVWVATELQFQMAPLLGTAGIVGIAIGFASQTSISNIISGFFLVIEQPFVIGDSIEVGAISGEVISIDMISVKLRTGDNRFVRIPNETMIKSNVVNITHFPIRRLDIGIGVAYKEDIGRVRAILLDIALKNPVCLIEPEPLVVFEGYGASAIDLKFLVWSAREDFLMLKNTIQEEIKARFDAAGIEIPFPQMAIHAGSTTAAFPLHLKESMRESVAAENDKQEGA